LYYKKEENELIDSLKTIQLDEIKKLNGIDHLQDQLKKLKSKSESQITTCQIVPPSRVRRSGRLNENENKNPTTTTTTTNNNMDIICYNNKKQPLLRSKSLTKLDPHSTGPQIPISRSHSSTINKAISLINWCEPPKNVKISLNRRSRKAITTKTEEYDEIPCRDTDTANKTPPQLETNQDCICNQVEEKKKLRRGCSSCSSNDNSLSTPLQLGRQRRLSLSSISPIKSDCNLTYNIRNQSKRSHSLESNNIESHQCLKSQNNALTNLKQSLEQNRAHLRRQLLLRDAEVNRLQVKLNIMTRKYEKAQLDVEIVQNKNKNKHSQSPSRPRSSPSPNRNKDVLKPKKCLRLMKSHYTFDEIIKDPYKIRLYVEKLAFLLKEKENAIKKLEQQRVDKPELDPTNDTKQQSTSQLILEENKQLKLELNELKLKNTMKSINSLSKTSPKRTIESGFGDELGESKVTTSDFTQQELNKVKQKLERRLVELEPLPELLKTTELKYEDISLKLKSSQLREIELKHIISDLMKQMKDGGITNDDNDDNDESSSLKSINKRMDNLSLNNNNNTLIVNEINDLKNKLSMKDQIVNDLNVSYEIKFPF
jgi:hypothetical protein